MCPHFFYYSPCINLIGKDWCPFQHIVDVRKAAQRQEEYFQNGEEPGEEVLHNIATQNAVTQEVKEYRIKLFRKYPLYPGEDTL